MPDQPDVVICGGGIAGGALAVALARGGVSVLVLEQQDEYRDLLRGEMLSPWGIEAAALLGVADCIYDAEPAPLRQWIHWDECHPVDEAPVHDLTGLVSGMEGPLAIRYSRTAAAFAAAGREAGAQIVMGAGEVRIEAGHPPKVTYTHAGARYCVQPRLVVGAGGRSAPIARQVGLRPRSEFHHWGGGLIVEGLDEWPAGVQAIGTEGHRMFFVFPQGGGRARLYLNFATENQRRYAGPTGSRVFLDDFALKCMPPSLSEMLVESRPVTPCGSMPCSRTTTERPYAEGVVLIGDEAGVNDPVLGTGLSCALDDARAVAQLLLENDRWDGALFERYRAPRDQRQARLHFAADVWARMFCEFGPEATERRARAFARMKSNPNLMLVLAVSLAGPSHTPAFVFSDLVIERLFADSAETRRRSKRRFALTA